MGIRIIAFILLAFVGRLFAQANLDSTVEGAMKKCDVPGIAVGVVKDGKVVVAKGYGVRKIGEAAPVTENTLFGIGSNTKAFTAAALAMLVDEGTVRWDDPVIEHLPSFQMYDSYVTREITVRDLLVHRSGLGLGAGDLMFFPTTDFSSAEIVKRLRWVKATTSFRSRYAYDNVLYLVAGQVIEAASGKKWDEFIRERFFKPLVMTHSITSASLLKPGMDYATSHSKVTGELRPLAPTILDNNAPAGALNSSVNDMLHWVSAQLSRGEYDGKRLFSENQSAEMWSPQTIIPLPQKPLPEMAEARPNFAAYGLGWMLTDYKGHKLVQHGGGLPGMVTSVTLVPDVKLGILVFTNQESSAALGSIAYTVLDHYLGGATKDWVGALASMEQRRVRQANEAVKKAAAKRNADSGPSLKPSGYAGRYRDAWYGDVLIAQQNGGLRIRFTHSPALAGTLEHWQYDTFIARWDDRKMLADAYVTFWLNPDGSIHEVRMKAVSPLTDFSYDFQDLELKPVPAESR